MNALKTTLKRADPTQTGSPPPGVMPNAASGQVGALKPPPGVTPNFVNGDSIALVLLVVACIGLGVMTICVSIRIWAIIIARRLRWVWSDFAFIFVVLTTTALLVVCILIATTTPYGHHQWDTPVQKWLTEHNIILLGLVTFFTSLSLGLVKIAIFLTYMEIFPLKWVKISGYTGIAITGAYYLGLVIACIYLQFPHIGETWVSHLFTPVSYRETVRTGIPTAVAGIVIDVYLFVIPFIAVMGTRMALKRKIGVLLIFATGVLAIVCSIVGLVYRLRVARNPDILWNIVPIWVVVNVEVAIGMIIACTPQIAKFLRTYENGFARVGSMIASAFRCKLWSKRYGKSTEPSTPSPSTSMSDMPKKPQKLYPNLDISTKGGTIDETGMDIAD